VADAEAAEEDILPELDEGEVTEGDGARDPDDVGPPCLEEALAAWQDAVAQRSEDVARAERPGDQVGDLAAADNESLLGPEESSDCEALFW
jgi:hypothetical protein